MSILPLESVLIRALVRDSYLVSLDRFAETVYSVASPFDAEALSQRTVDVRNGKEKLVGPLLSNAECVVGFDSGVVILANGSLFVFEDGFKRRIQGPDRFIMVKVVTESDVRVLMCLTERPAVIGFSLDTGELLFEREAPLYHIRSCVPFKIAGLHSMALVDNLNNATVMIRDVCDVFPSQVLLFERKLVGIIVFLRHFLYLIFDNGSYTAARCAEDISLNVDAKMLLPVRGGRFGDPVHGKVLTVLDIGRDKWIVCQEHGWVIYSIIGLTVVEQFSSPLPSRYAHAVAYVYGTSYCVAIETDNMVIMLVRDGNVRLVDGSLNRFLKTVCFQSEKTLRGVFMDDITWWCCDMNLDSDDLTWGPRSVLSEHVAHNKFYTAELSRDTGVIGDTNGRLSLTSSGKTKVASPILESAISGISYFNVAGRDLVWAMDTCGNLAIILFCTNQLSFRKFLVPARLSDKLKSIHVLQGSSCISLEYKSGAQVVFDVDLFAPLFSNRVRDEHMPHEYELPLPKPNADPGATYMTIKSAIEGSYIVAGDVSSVESIIMTKGMDATFKANSFSIRDLCRCCLLPETSQVSLSILQKLLENSSLDDIIQTWTPKLSFLPHNYDLATARLYQLFATIILSTIMFATSRVEIVHPEHIIRNIMEGHLPHDMRIKTVMLKLLLNSYDTLTSRSIVSPVDIISVVLAVRSKHNVRLITEATEVDHMLVFDECTKFADVIFQQNPDSFIVIMSFLLMQEDSNLLSLKVEVIEILNHLLLEDKNSFFFHSSNRIMLVWHSLLLFEKLHLNHHHHHHHHNHRDIDDIHSQLHDAFDLSHSILTSKYARVCSQIVVYEPSKFLGADHAVHKVCVSTDLSSLSLGVIDDYAGVVYEESRGHWQCSTLNWRLGRDRVDAELKTESTLAGVLVSPQFSQHGTFVAGIDFWSYEIVVWDLSHPQEYYSRNFRWATDIPLQVPEFPYMLVQYYWRHLRRTNGADFADSALLEALKHMRPTQEYEGHCFAYMPSKSIDISEILNNYNAVFSEISQGDVSLGWMSPDSISLKINDRVVYIYSLND